IIGLILFLFVATSNAQTAYTQLKLDYFDKIPAQVDGCSGLYTYDSVSLKKEKSIVITDLNKFAYIQVKGDRIQLVFAGPDSLLGVNFSQTRIFKKDYKGINYQVILRTKPEKNSDKSW